MNRDAASIIQAHRTNEYVVVNQDSHKLSNSLFTEILEAVLAKGAPLRFEARGSSMFPFIHNTDVITISKTSSRIRVGDVVAFSNPDHEGLTVHRVVRLSKESFLIKGDNSKTSDGWIPRDRIMGCVTSVEHAGSRVRIGLGIERLGIAFLSRKGWLGSFLAPIRGVYRLLFTRLMA